MYKKFFKRVLDILVSIPALFVFALAFIVLAPIIHFTDKGPVFYVAERRGRNGKNFRMYKFRSMYVDSPVLHNPDGSTLTSDKDPRVTKIGRVMRKTSVDELPQFINVLKGDMSVIGPRPCLGKTPYEQLGEVRKKGLTVRPGITGYSQAYFRNSITQDEKFKNDAYYAEHVSFTFDMKIFFKTIASVLGRKNVNANAGVKEEQAAKTAGEPAEKN